MTTTFQRMLLGASALLVISLAACGGSSSSTPSTGSNPTGGSSPSGSPSPTSSPTGLAYAFSGPTGSVAFTSGVAGASGSIPSNSAVPYTVALTFPGSASATGTIDLADAVSPSTQISPALTADNATAGNTAVVYVSLYNPGTTAITLGSDTPQVVVTGSGLAAYAACELDIYGANQSGTWGAVSGTGSVSGNSVTVPSANLGSSGNVKFNGESQSLGAISCH